MQSRVQQVLSWWLGSHCGPWPGQSHHRGEGRTWKTMNWGMNGRQERGASTVHPKPKLKKLPGLPPTTPFFFLRVTLVFILITWLIHSPHKNCTVPGTGGIKRSVRGWEVRQSLKERGWTKITMPHAGDVLTGGHKALGKEHLQAPRRNTWAQSWGIPGNLPGTDLPEWKYV